jgi:hypothetical protein
MVAGPLLKVHPSMRLRPVTPFTSKKETLAPTRAKSLTGPIVSLPMVKSTPESERMFRLFVKLTSA